MRIIFQGEAYGRGRGDGSADEHGCIVNNYSDLNMQQYKKWPWIYSRILYHLNLENRYV